MSKKDLDITEFYKTSLARELQILKEAVDAHKRGDKQGMADKFNELCEVQEQVMWEEARYETEEVIHNARRNAERTIQSRNQQGISGSNGLNKTDEQEG
jgi:ribosome modulation factor